MALDAAGRQTDLSVPLVASSLGAAQSAVDVLWPRLPQTSLPLWFTSFGSICTSLLGGDGVLAMSAAISTLSHPSNQARVQRGDGAGGDSSPMAQHVALREARHGGRAVELGEEGGVSAGTRDASDVEEGLYRG